MNGAVIVRVALDVPLATLFDYTVDEAVLAGQRVIVPFRHGERVGVVVECVTSSEYSEDKIKPVIAVLHDSAPLSPKLLALLKFCSDYYHYPIGQTVLPALPAKLRSSQSVAIKPALYYRMAEHAPDLALLPKRKAHARLILEKLVIQSCNLRQL